MDDQYSKENWKTNRQLWEDWTRMSNLIKQMSKLSTHRKHF